MTWGTVYDSITKRPIPFVKLQLLDTQKRVLETRISDRDGRYGFLTTPASLLEQTAHVSIAPTARGYTFPSQAVASVDAFIYDHLYHGEPLEIGGDRTIVNADIPMDPDHPVRAPLLTKSPSVALGITVAAMADIGFWLGLILVPLNVALFPNPFTLGVLFLFLGTASLRVWGITERPFGMVLDRTTRRPMPFALLTLTDRSGARRAFTVSDERGRYVLVVPKGEYDVTVVTSAMVAPARQTTEHIATRRGWLTHTILL